MRLKSGPGGPNKPSDMRDTPPHAFAIVFLPISYVLDHHLRMAGWSFYDKVLESSMLNSYLSTRRYVAFGFETMRLERTAGDTIRLDPTASSAFGERSVRPGKSSDTALRARRITFWMDKALQATHERQARGFQAPDFMVT